MYLNKQNLSVLNRAALAENGLICNRLKFIYSSFITFNTKHFLGNMNLSRFLKHRKRKIPLWI